LFTPDIAERTTAATDLLLGIVCLALVPSLAAGSVHEQWRASLWETMFVLLAAASLLGAVVHGVALSDRWRRALWQPLYLILGMLVALFVVGAAGDWLGDDVARRLYLPAVAVGALFWLVSRGLGGSFLVFVVYEGIAMAASLVIYVALACNGATPGAALIAAAIALNLVAAAIQASSLRVTIVWPFDHNGLFHLVQIAAVVLLQQGVVAGLGAPGAPARGF
jgi:hypothetical protein